MSGRLLLTIGQESIIIKVLLFFIMGENRENDDNEKKTTRGL